MKKLDSSKMLTLTVVAALLVSIFAQKISTEVSLNLQVNERYVYDLSSAYNGCAENI